MALRQAASRHISILVFLLALCSWALPAEGASASFLGEFSNVRYTDEHAYGYSVLLWKEGDKLFGLFYDSEGLAGDNLVGLLEDIQLDSSGDGEDVTADLISTRLSCTLLIEFSDSACTACQPWKHEQRCRRGCR